MATDKDIRLTILRKMMRGKYIGKRHTSIDNIPKGFPKSDRGRVKRIANRMLKAGYFVLYKKPDSLHISLNPLIISKIKKELRSE